MHRALITFKAQPQCVFLSCHRAMSKRGIDQFFPKLQKQPGSKKAKPAPASAQEKDRDAAPWDDWSAPENVPPQQPQAQQQQQQQPPKQQQSSVAEAQPFNEASSGTDAAPQPEQQQQKAAAGAAAGGSAFTALMAAAKGKQPPGGAKGREKQLSPQEMQQLASSNQAAVVAAVQNAAAQQQQLQLRSLLVEPSWQQVLGPEFDKPYMQQLQAFLEGEWSSQVIYPQQPSIFRAFNSVPFSQVRVVILGQDPYINAGEAMGLSFSVPPGVRVPPSLANMYKELAADLSCSTPNHGCLEKWCSQGVLLLNAALTVRAKTSNSHAGKGWEGFTSAALAALARQRSGIVFLLWGKYAQDRCAKLDMSRHHVLKAVHPSPLSAHRGFLGCRHFSAANKLLQQSGLPPVDWQIERI